MLAGEVIRTVDPLRRRARSLARGVASAPCAAGELNPFWRLGLPLVAPARPPAVPRPRSSASSTCRPGGAAIVAFNHVSALDGPALAIEVEPPHPARDPVPGGGRVLPRSRSSGGCCARRPDPDPPRRGRRRRARPRVWRRCTTGPWWRSRPRAGVNPEPRGDLQRIRSGVARLALPDRRPDRPGRVCGARRSAGRRPASSGGDCRAAHGSRSCSDPPLLPDGEAGTDADVEDLKERLRVRLEEQVTAARELAEDPAQ